MREDDVSGSKLCGVVGSLSRTTSGERFGCLGDRQLADGVFSFRPATSPVHVHVTHVGRSTNFLWCFMFLLYLVSTP